MEKFKKYSDIIRRKKAPGNIPNFSVPTFESTEESQYDFIFEPRSPTNKDNARLFRLYRRLSSQRKIMKQNKCWCQEAIDRGIDI